VTFGLEKKSLADIHFMRFRNAIHEVYSTEYTVEQTRRRTAKLGGFDKGIVT
jgi:hypothetical protein|tara:strand:+ start:451 stop:606 length:156 start_codon:yes stop_codon:yes gene_type:complete